MSGRKATKPKDLKRLLTEHKAGAFKTSKAPELMLQWVYDSPKKPPVEALVSVIGPTGEVLPPIEVNERTACRDILKVSLYLLILFQMQLKVNDAILFGVGDQVAHFKFVQFIVH